MATIDILLSTCNRIDSLIYTLGGLAGQTLHDFDLIIADQSQEPVTQSPVVQALLRILEAHGSQVAYHHRLPSKGIAEQRDFLLRQAAAPYVLYLDDDVFMESWVLEHLLNALVEEGCAFAGAFPAGLSFRNDVRPQQQTIEYWDGPVQPEIVDPETEKWERFHLHRAANLYHVSQTQPAGSRRRYKVAWIASCILYDREKLVEIGGFSFWQRLPRHQSGEEVLVQNLLMRRWGGFAIIPSGTYSSEMPSTVLNDAGSVDGHALSLLPEMVERYAPVAAPSRG